jgi:hypothetical protein
MSERAARLRRAGEVAGRGELSIERDKAWEKLRKYRLPDPHLFVLQLVRTASALGATRVDFSISPMRVECTFDAVVPKDLLRDIWHAAFAERRSAEEEAIHYLAQAVGAMQALQPARIEVRSGTLQWSITGEDEHYEEPSDRWPTKTTRITLQEKFRFGRLPDFYSRIAGDPPEVAALRTYCWSSAMPVTVNGYRVDHPRKIPYASRVERGMKVATVGLLTPEELRRRAPKQGVVVRILGVRTRGPGEGSPPRSLIRVLKHDVELQHAAKSLPIQGGVPAIGRIDVPRLETDLSGLSPIADESFHRTLDRLGFEAYHRSLARWIETKSDREKRDLLREVLQWADGWNHGDLPDASQVLIDTLLREKLWTRAGMRRRTLQTADKGADGSQPISLTKVIRDDELHYADREFPDVELDHGQPCLFRPGSIQLETLRLLARLRGLELVNRTASFELQVRRRRNVARWKARPPREPLPYRFRRKVEAGAYTAWAYLPVDERGRVIDGPALRFFISGRFLAERRLSPGVSVDLDGPFETTPDFSDVVTDRSLRPLVEATLEAVVSVIKSFEAAVSKEGLPLRTEHAALFRHILLAPDRSRRLRKGLELDQLLFQSTADEIREALIDVPCFDLYDRRDRAPLRALRQSSLVYVLKREGDWEKYARVGASEEMDLVLCKPGQFEAYRLLLGERTRDARRRLERRVTERRSSRGARYEATGETLARGEPDEEPAEPDPRVDTRPDTEPDTRPDTTLSPETRDDLLTRIAEQLRIARGEDTSLIGDDLIRSICWTDEPLDEAPVCSVTPDGTFVCRDAPLVAEIEPSDPGQVAWMTSVIATEINRFYLSISDFDELEIQRRLLDRRPGETDD